MPFEMIQNFEAKPGFKSAYSYRKEVMNKAEELSESEISNYLKEKTEEGYFDKYNQEFVYPFYNESYAVVLNSKGKVKVGNVFYQFNGETETVTPDLTDIKINKNTQDIALTIQLNASMPKLKGGEMLEEAYTVDGKLKCLLQLKREEFAAYDWIIDGGQVVWGIVGYHWDVYYRFYSYKKRTFYKTDKPTYFNWKTKQAQIGGNSVFWYLNYYNSNPNTERSPNELAKSYFTIYDSGLVNSAYPPNVSAVQVIPFWSDLINDTATLIYN